MDHKINIRQLGHSIAKSHAELSALLAMLAEQMSQIEGRVTACEQKLSWKIASPPEQIEPLGNESAKLVGGV